MLEIHVGNYFFLKQEISLKNYWNQPILNDNEDTIGTIEKKLK